MSSVAPRPTVFALLAVAGFCSMPTAARAVEPPDLAPEHVASLLSLQQQFADIDSWQTSQFKPSAWARAATGLKAQLAQPRADKFKDAVQKLRADQFRGCIDANEYKKFRDELARLKDDSRPAGKDNPIQLSEDVVETVMVLEAACPWLDAAADGWREPLDDHGAEAAVLRALNAYQTFHRRLAKVRLLSGQPEWVLKVFGPALAKPLDEAREVLTKIDLDFPENAPLTEDQLRKLPPRTDAITVRTQDEKLRAVTQVVTDWFKEHGGAVRKRRAEWEEKFRTPTVDIPADGPTSGKWFVRATLKPLAGGRFEARLSLCRALPTAVRGGVDAVRFQKEFTAPVPVAPKLLQPVLEELDLGVTLASVQLTGGTVVLPPSGLGADRTDDRPALTRALHRLGLPLALGVERVEVVSVSPDLTSFKLRYAVSLPGLGLAHEDTLELTPTANNSKDSFNGVLNARIDALRDQLIKLANQKPLEIPVPGGRVRAVNWRSAGDWRAGTLALVADLTFPNLGMWTVPLELVKGDKGWFLRPGAHSVPAKVLDDALAQFRAEAVKGLEFTKLPKETASKVGKIDGFVGKFATRVVLADPVFDPQAGTVSADVRWAEPDLPGAKTIPAAKLEIRLAVGDVRFDAGPMRDAIAQQWPQLALAVFNQFTGNLEAVAVRGLKDKPLTFFGQPFKVVEVGNFDDARNGVPVDFVATVGGRDLRVNKCWLLGLMLPVRDTVDAVKVDFSEATTQPGLGEFLALLTGTRLKLDAGLVQVSGERPTADGFRATVTLRVDALGGPMPLGDLTFNRAEAGADLNLDALKSAFVKRFTAKITIPDLGPVRNLQIDSDTVLAPDLRVFVKGELVVGELDSALPFAGVQVFPKFDPSKVKIDPATPALAKLLKDVLPLPTDTVITVTNIKPKRTAPYGVSFDLGVNFWVLNLNLGQVSITTAGVDVPEKVQLRLPAFISLGPLALVNPGIGIYLKEAGKIDILGDLTFVSPGIEKIITIRCTLTADLKTLNFHLNGDLVALSFLPVFAVDGDVDLKRGVFDLTGKSLPPLDRIIALTGNVHVDGPAFQLTSTTNMTVLGLKLHSINLLIDGRTALFKVDGSMNVLIGDGHIRAEMSADLARCNASADLKLKVLRDNIAARADISPGRVQLQFNVRGVKVTIIAPAVGSLTPSLVRDLIKSILDIDPRKLKGQKLRDVVINLIDNKGNPTEGSIGQGQPLPPGQSVATDQTPSTGGPQQQPKDNQQGIVPASDFGGVPPTGGGPGSNSGEGGAGTSWISPRGEIPKHNRPTKVVTYQPGTASATFEPDPNAPGKFYEITTDGTQRWSSHFSIESSVKDAIKKPTTLVLADTWVNLPPGTVLKCRADKCGPHNYVPVYVTLDVEQKALCCAGLYPGGRYEELAVKTEQIGPGLTADKLWERITTHAEKPLLPGDIAVLVAAAQAKVDPKQGFGGLRRIRAGSGNAADDGYLFQGSAESRSWVTYFGRRGGVFSVDHSHTLYPVLADSNSKLGAELAQFLAERTAAADWFTVLAVDHDAPKPGTVSLAKRVVFVRSDNEKRLWVEAVGSTGRKSVQMTSAYTFRGDWTLSQYSGTTFAAALADGVLSGSWDEVRLSTSLSMPRQFSFASKLETAVWAVAVVREQKKDGPMLKAELTGAALTKNYVAWQAKKAVTPTGSQALSDLGTGAQRRQLLDLITGPDTDWPKYFQANPAGLLVPSK